MLWEPNGRLRAALQSGNVLRLAGHLVPRGATPLRMVPVQETLKRCDGPNQARPDSREPRESTGQQHPRAETGVAIPWHVLGALAE